MNGPTPEGIAKGLILTTFTDGPGKDLFLELPRTPDLMRLHSTEGGTIGAMASLGDKVPRDVVLYAYRKTHNTWAHVTFSVQDGPRGAYIDLVWYELVKDQPDQETMHDTELWREWCWSKTRAEQHRNTPHEQAGL